MRVVYTCCCRTCHRGLSGTRGAGRRCGRICEPLRTVASWWLHQRIRLSGCLTSSPRRRRRTGSLLCDCVCVRVCVCVCVFLCVHTHESNASLLVCHGTRRLTEHHPITSLSLSHDGRYALVTVSAPRVTVVGSHLRAFPSQHTRTVKAAGLYGC